MSSIVRLTPYAKPAIEIKSINDLNTVVTTAFSQRRKTLRNSLKKLITEEQITGLGINPTLRAESISLAEFAKLSYLVDKGNGNK